MVGYRWYEHKKIEPLFPFGFGLSYTDFSLSDAQLSSATLSKGSTLQVSVEVANTGDVEGATVVQCYIKENEPSLPRPPKELKAYKKVFLKAGESQRVTLTLEPSAFAFWCPKANAWTTNSGTFEVLIGQSSAAISEQTSLVIQ